MHIAPLEINYKEQINAHPLHRLRAIQIGLWAILALGAWSIFYGVTQADPSHFWGVFYVNVVYWMGIAAGATIISCILQIVGSIWSIPVRRVVEAPSSFLWYGLVLLLLTYFGKEQLFTWARAPMPGREWWMQTDFVFVRFTLLFALLFWLFSRFIGLSLRRDIGIANQFGTSNKKSWTNMFAEFRISNWLGAKKEVSILNDKISWNAPLMVVLYAIIYSLFAFEMIMGMNPMWYSTMFGGFIFIGNIFSAWAFVSLLTIFLKSAYPGYSRMVGGQQLHDLGKLTFGFSILWAYLFFSQFLPIWYGNLPEETQWVILRTREHPWKLWGWVTLGMCFIAPFILLLNRDIKKTPPAFAIVCVVVLIGMWMERYILIMPELTGHRIPFSLLDIGVSLFFGSAFLLCVFSFLSKYPIIPLGHNYFKNDLEILIK